MENLITTFDSEASAMADIEAAGFHSITMEFAAGENEPHWHDFDAFVFVLEGELVLTDVESGESRVCGPGTKVQAARGVLHRESTPGYKALIGFSQPLDDLTQPIDKPPPVQLPA